MSRVRALMKNWYSVEVLPIYVITAAACGGASWYLYRLSTRPEVVWNHHGNPYPWQSVEQGTNVKLMNVNQKFDKDYKRDRF